VAVSAARRAALRALLPVAEVDALLVTDLVNVRYLTGFTGSHAALLVHADGDAASRFCTDDRYRAMAAAQVPDLEPVFDRAGALALAAGAHERGVRLLGFESQHVTVDDHMALDAVAEGVVLRRAPGLVEQLRAVKDAGEVALLARACALADEALAGLLAAGGLRPGRTERAAALDLDDRVRSLGAAGPAFETILAAGEHSAVPHHRPTDRPLRTGDLVKIDFGALVEGYHSDTTRTFVLGPAAEWQRELHALVARAQRAGCAALAPGAATADVDAAARGVVEAAGRGAEFVHGLGHGVGLRIHEAPALGRSATDVLAAGMAVTVEPGVYLEGRGGVRIEDVLVVRDGGAQPLTSASRDLVEL
jgi:Xaa-Pro aminopeptidase